MTAQPRVAPPRPTAPAPARGERVDVVHVTQAMKAGLRRYVLDLVGGLHAIGVRQALVYSPMVTDAATAGALAEIARLGVPVYEVPMERSISPLRDAASAARLWRLLRRLAPEVLHLHSSKAGGLGRVVAAVLPQRIAVVYTAHGNAANFSPRYAVIERALGRLRTDRVVALSPSEYDELAGLRFVAPGRLVRVDTGIPIADIRRAAKEAPPPLPPGPLVVAAGRLSPPKDAAMLVRVSARLRAAHPALRYVWAGDGELRPAVEREIADAGVGDLWALLGWVANPYPVLAAATVVVLPSGFEAMPLVLLEAMALGRPMVSTDVTGARDLVIPGETGELVAVGDEAALAAAIDRVVRDPARAARYGAEAARRAEAHYTRERMAAEMLAVYRDCSALA